MTAIKAMGVTLCERIPLCICRLRGDPLLETFDGQWLMVIGQKKYTMVKHMNPDDDCSFNVEVKTEPSSANPDKTYPNFMDVEVYNLKIRISNSLVVTIGDQEITLPANNTHHPGLAIYKSDGYVVVETDCGLRVGFNGKSQETAATLTIPPRYAKHIVGMCGDCDGLQDDLTLKNGTDVSNHPDKYTLISNSYSVDESDSQFLPNGVKHVDAIELFNDINTKMIACCLWLCVFSVFMGLAPVNTLLEILNSNDLHYVLHATMRDGGMLELKKFIEEQYTVTAGHFNVNTYLKQVKTAIGDRISKRAKLLKKLRDVAAANYQRTSRRTTFKTCCRQRLRDLLWSDLLDRYVNYKGMCLHPPPWLQRETKPNYPGPALLDRFILTHRTDILIRQQYFADENGLQTAYPASRIRNEDCAYMEMRTRPWYVNAVTPPKDIVILVDTSTAMKTKKLDVAKDIAHLLVQTANPNDQLSVFGFSGASVAACGGPSSCYANKSVSPVAFPRRDLHRFISSLSAKGETRYKTGLSKALSMLANQDNSTRHKRRVVVLISGAEPEEDKIGIASFLDTRIQALGVSTKFITICIDCNTRLTKFMNMLISKGNQDVGLYIDVISRKIGEATLLTKTLYEQLRLFFVNLADESMNKAILTTQYYNYIGIGAMVTLSMPVFYRHKFIGVMAIDMAVSDFTTAVKSSVYTYFFLVSQTDGVTLYHPLLPQPTDMEDDPLIVRINFLERDADRKDIIASILRGENGTKKIVVTRIVTLGDSVGDTIEEIVINSTFMWQPIEHMAYSICVVVGERDNEDDTLYTQKNTFGFTYTYHNFISNQDVEKCSYWKRIAAKNKAVVKFPVTTCVDMLEKTIVKFPMTALIDISDKAVVKFPVTTCVDVLEKTIVKFPVTAVIDISDKAVVKFPVTTCVDVLEKTIVKFPVTAVIDISDKAVVKLAVTTCVDMLEKTIVKFPMTAVIDISDKAVVKFPVTAFIDTPAYMSERETSERIGWYADVIHGRRANDIFRVGLRRYTKLRSIRYDTIRYDTIRCCGRFMSRAKSLQNRARAIANDVGAMLYGNLVASYDIALCIDDIKPT
ncbi:hypothetical protein LSAT2_016413 [Lamellibrachia satsuma]|nr:hypothetical protein LSAT2_016413 [Lamellibrachia satsuma]